MTDVFQPADNRAPKPIRYWCQDESRFGFKTLAHRVIAALGINPRGAVRGPFEASCAHGAVEPLAGESFFLLFSRLDSQCFQPFPDEFAAAYPASPNAVQPDSGAFHKAKKLEIPENAPLLFQPAYSPDINPIERVWRYPKKQDSRLNFETLADLQKSLPTTRRALAGNYRFTGSLSFCSIGLRKIKSIRKWY